MVRMGYGGKHTTTMVFSDEHLQGPKLIAPFSLSGVAIVKI
jgi:hypothetical protein